MTTNQRIANDLQKEFEGTLDILEGEIREENGEHFKGRMQALKGKAQVKGANVDLDMLDFNERIKKHITKAKHKAKRDIQRVFA